MGVKMNDLNYYGWAGAAVQGQGQAGVGAGTGRASVKCHNLPRDQFYFV